MLTYETLESNSALFVTLRTAVPGGWLVVVDADYGTGVTFFPDPDHAWDGSSVPPREPIVTPSADAAPAGTEPEPQAFTPADQG
ncbi:MAG TPA: hypothetical protein VF092_23535 [Longimicrobium sp.]